MAKNYSEAEVVESLKRNPDLNVLYNTRTIQQLKGDEAKGTVGIKTNGKIDYLVNHCDWTHYKVTTFKK